jgi:hypothetical protein
LYDKNRNIKIEKTKIKLAREDRYLSMPVDFICKRYMRNMPYKRNKRLGPVGQKQLPFPAQKAL